MTIGAEDRAMSGTPEEALEAQDRVAEWLGRAASVLPEVANTFRKHLPSEAGPLLADLERWGKEAGELASIIRSPGGATEGVQEARAWLTGVLDDGCAQDADNDECFVCRHYDKLRALTKGDADRGTLKRMAAKAAWMLENGATNENADLCREVIAYFRTQED